MDTQIWRTPRGYVRYRLAYDHDRCTAVLRIFIRAVLGFYRRRARERGVFGGRIGSVTCVQRFGSAANLNLHLRQGPGPTRAPSQPQEHDSSNGYRRP